MNDSLPTIKEFAFEHRVCTRTVRRWARAGRIVVVTTLAGKRVDVRKCPLLAHDSAIVGDYCI